MEETQTAALNTDLELWIEVDGDHYSDSIDVTETGGIGMNVGGHVIVMPIREWHRLAARVKKLEVAWKASNDLLVRTTMMIGEIESTANRWLPYRVKELKIAVDMQVMSNARTRNALTKEQSVEPCKKSGGEE